jgi:formylglycine-generating enzyme required for sulfatase activity
MPTLLEPTVTNIHLGQHLKNQGGPLPTPEVLRLFSAIARMVGDMHEQFAVYEELSVEQIILNDDDPPRILDCGVPKSRERARAATPTEIAEGVETDIYNLGVVLFQLATGQLPPQRRTTFNFRAETDILDRPPLPDPRLSHPNTSELIAITVARATTSDPLKRAKSVRELLEIFELPPETPLQRAEVKAGPTAEVEPKAPQTDASGAPVRPEAKVTLSKRALPVVSNETGFVTNERELKAQRPTTNAAPPEPANVVDRLAQAFADLSDTGEKPTGVGFKYFLAGMGCLILFVIGLAIFRVVDKVTAGEGGPGATQAQTVPAVGGPARPKLAPATAPADVSADLPPLVAIAGTTFKMGNAQGQPDEQPLHDVTLAAFEIGKYEVTNAQYKAFCDATRRPYPEEPNFPNIRDYFEKYPNFPVVRVSWEDANAYCVWLSEKTGDLYRLPTEAEWESVARDAPLGWDSYNSGGAPHEVGTSQPNKAGVYDLMGNVWEWCADWYSPYSDKPQTNPKGQPRGTHKVLRGCSWYFSTVPCSATSRFRFEPSLNYWFNGGFRVVRAKN